MTAMLTPYAARTTVAKVYRQRFAGWATAAARAGSWEAAEASRPESDVWLVDRPLHPPAERVALADTDGVAAWIRAWRSADPDDGPDGHITWDTRRWASLGTQELPTRLQLGTPGQVARFAGRQPHWRRAVDRARRLLDVLGRRSPAKDLPSTSSDPVGVAVTRALGSVVALDDADVGRLIEMLDWLLTHPTSGLFVRQVPVRGIDTKWLERHRRIVEPLYSAASGRPGLDLAARPPRIRVRFLDPALAPGGLGDVTAPPHELDLLAVAPRVVIVVENLETLLALPAHPGVVAMHGQGYAVRQLVEIGWVASADVLYWGDLDTDGLNILSALRSHVPHTRSVLMDRATLIEHADLTVPDPRPRRSVPERLTVPETDALAALRELGDVRLEQERIPWTVATRAISEVLDGPVSVIADPPAR